MGDDRLNGPWTRTPTGIIVRAVGVLIVPAPEAPPNRGIPRPCRQEGPATPLAARLRQATQGTNGRRPRR